MTETVNEIVRDLETLKNRQNTEENFQRSMKYNLLKSQTYGQSLHVNWSDLPTSYPTKLKVAI